jgi:hypothetical protein
MTSIVHRGLTLPPCIERRSGPVPPRTLGHDGPMLLGRVTALQDFLGCFNDADVAAKLARDVLVAQAGELTKVEAEAIGSYLHSRERELARRRRSLGPVWRAVDGSPFRRALGRATAGL